MLPPGMFSIQKVIHSLPHGTRGKKIHGLKLSKLTVRILEYILIFVMEKYFHLNNKVKIFRECGLTFLNKDLFWGVT
jgi:hypothetical protein